MEVWLALLLLLAALVGLLFLARGKKTPARTAGLAVLALAALGLMGYLLLTAVFLSAM